MDSQEGSPKSSPHRQGADAEDCYLAALLGKEASPHGPLVLPPHSPPRRPLPGCCPRALAALVPWPCWALAAPGLGRAALTPGKAEQVKALEGLHRSGQDEPQTCPWGPFC